jgi:hypothetical protein
MRPIILLDTDNWIVLTRAPFAFGPFESRTAAQEYAERIKCTDAIITAWHEPEWISESYPPAFGAVWVDWDYPYIVVGPFYDVADAVNSYGNGRPGMAVELDECPEEHDAYSEQD